MTGPRVVTVDELRAQVRFEDLIEPVSAAFQETSAQCAQNGFLTMYPGPDAAAADVFVKTGVLKGHPVFVVKVSPWYADNAARGETQGGFIAVFDSRNGRTLAILNEEHYLSDIRTAAAGSLAARAFAPARVDVAAVIGAGVQAYWQPQALYRERPFRTLLIWARDRDRAQRLQERLAAVLPRVATRVETDLESAVRHADVLMTTTSAREAIVEGAWLHAGQHVTAVGADDPTKCELAATALQRARVFVDSRAAAAAGGDVGRAIQAGEYALADLAGELGDVLAGRQAGRRSGGEITIAKFIGIGAQDLVAAETSLDRLGIGRA